MTESTETAMVKYDKDLRAAPGSLAQVRTLLKAYRAEMEPHLPQWAGISLDKIISTAVQQVSENVAVARCSGDSILRSVKTAVEFGLSFSKQLGQAYLVPYKQTCQLIIGYRGLLDLIRRAADVDTIEVGAAFEGDVYEEVKGTSPSLTHKPDPRVPRDEAHFIAAYMVSTYHTGRQTVWDVNKQQVNEIRARSKASAGGPWKTDYVPMAIKTCIRAGWKYLPVSAEKARLVERALAHDDETAGIAARHAPPPETKGVGDMLDTPPAEPTPEPDDAIDAESRVVSDLDLQRQEVHNRVRAIAKTTSKGYAYVLGTLCKRAGLSVPNKMTAQDARACVLALDGDEADVLVEKAKSGCEKAGADVQAFAEGGPEYESLEAPCES